MPRPRRRGKDDTGAAPIETGMHDRGGTLEGHHERLIANEAVGHGRVEKSGDDDAAGDPMRRQRGTQPVAIGPNAGLAGAVSRAVGKAAVAGDGGDDRDVAAAPRQHAREQRLDDVHRAE